MVDAMVQALSQCIQTLILELNAIDGVDDCIINQLTEALERVGSCGHRRCTTMQFLFVFVAVQSDNHSKLITQAFRRCSKAMVTAYMKEDDDADDFIA